MRNAESRGLGVYDLLGANDYVHWHGECTSRGTGVRGLGPVSDYSIGRSQASMTGRRKDRPNQRSISSDAAADNAKFPLFKNSISNLLISFSKNARNSWFCTLHLLKPPLI